MRLFSGIRPTGRLHLGHLVGALENWVRLQEDYDCFFTIADIHALTTRGRDKGPLGADIIRMAACWRALGIDFVRSVVFVQSDVAEHSELSVLLSMVTPMSWLERDPTLKSMREDLHIKSVSYGLMGYPVLQAADILLYRTERVPVGLDQAPHIELAREIARAFNRNYGELFPEPQAILTEHPKLLGTDGRKMSKSLGNCIYLDDPPEAIAKGINSLVTDPSKLHADDPGDPDLCSVQAYHKVFRPDDAGEHESLCRTGGLGCVEHKKYVARILSERMEGFRERLGRFMEHPDETAGLLREGAARARKAARETMQDIRRLIGIGLPQAKKS